jgi:predicted peptidase
MKINMKEKKQNKNILFFVIILLALTAVYILIHNKNKSPKEIIEEPIPQQEQPQTEEKPIEEGPQYEEILPIIEEQQAYICVPANINKNNPPALVIYSHGSNTSITDNMEDSFMKDMHSYGVLFAANNYIFSASNQHGVNWGNRASVQDMINLKKWIEERYSIQPKINLIGFSMGGLPTLNFATQYPDIVEKIALLAPSIKSAEWNSTRAQKLKDIQIKLWHGNKDVNVPYSSSVSFVKKLQGYGITIDFVTVEDKGHFDIDTEYMQDILEFFST